MDVGGQYYGSNTVRSSQVFISALKECVNIFKENVFPTGKNERKEPSVLHLSESICEHLAPEIAFHQNLHINSPELTDNFLHCRNFRRLQREELMNHGTSQTDSGWIDFEFNIID